MPKRSQLTDSFQLNPRRVSQGSVGIKLLIDGNTPSAGGKSRRFGSARPAGNARRPLSLRPRNTATKKEVEKATEG